jgi:nucleotide-binding universal stress UspA family protein
MFKKILVPRDGSEASERIGGWVAGFAQCMKAEVVLLAVVDTEHPHLRDVAPSAGEPGDEQSTSLAVGLAEIYVEYEAERLNASGVKASTMVLVGKPADAITEHAQRLGCDMIAMATHADSEPARGVLGSVTDRVLHSTDLPVLTIRPAEVSTSGGNAGVPRAVIIPLDGSELSEKAVAPGLEVAKTAQAEVLFVNSVHLPYGAAGSLGTEYYGGHFAMSEQRWEVLKYLSRFDHVAKEMGLGSRTHAAVGNPAARIIEDAHGLDGALIVMTTHGSGGPTRWALGGVTDKVIRSSKRPVLVIPADRA